MITQKVSKTSVKASLLKLRSLVAAIVLFLIAQAGWSATYYWVGGASGDWTTDTNWNTAADGSGTDAPTGGPLSTDNVYIHSAAEISIGNNNISIAGISLGSNNQTTAFTVKFTGTGTLNVGNYLFPENTADYGIVTYRPSYPGIDTDIKSSLVFECNVNAATLSIHSGGTVTIGSGTSATITTVNMMANNANTATNLAVYGNLISTTITAVNISNQTIYVDEDAVLSTQTISGSSGFITNNGLVITEDPINSNYINGSSQGTETEAVPGVIIWNGADSSWNTASNWIGGIPITDSVVLIPAERDSYPSLSVATADLQSLTIDADASLSIETGGTLNATVIVNDGSITVTDGSINAGTSITNNNTITFSGGTIAAPTKTNGSSSSIVNYSGSITTPVWGNNYQNLQIVNGTDITISNDTSVTGNAENNGTITVSSCSLSADTFSGTGTINLTGGTTVLTAANATTDSAQNSIVLSNTSSTISGNFTLTSFNAATNMNGQSVTLNGSIITAASVSLSGASGSLLSLVGDGTNHKFDTSSLAASYLSIDSNIELDNYTTALSDCEPTADSTNQANWVTVLHNGWNIKNLTTLAYTWTGTAGTAWNTAENWDTLFVPATDCKIIIPAVTNLPVLPDTTCAGGTLTIASGASVQLGANNLVLSGNEGAVAGTRLSNAGTIIYTGGGRITDGANAINDTAHGTVEYAAGSGGNITDFDTGTGDDYYNLVIKGNKNWTINGSTIKAKNEIKIDTDSICNVSDSSTLQTVSFNFIGSFAVANEKDVTLTPYSDSDDFVIPAALQSKFDFAGPTWGWVIVGNNTYAGTIKFNTAVNGTANGSYFPYKLHFKSNVQLNANIRVTNSIWAEKDITGDGILTFGGPGNQIFTTTDTFTYNKIVENKNGGTFTLTSNGTIKSLSITKGITTTFSGTPTIISFTADEGAGSIIFSAGGNITNTNNEVIAANGNVSIDSSSAPFTVTGDFKQTAGTTTVSGNNITAANFYAANLITTADSTITTTSGKQTYGTIDGTTAFTENLILNASTVTLNGSVGAVTSLASLTVNANLAVGTTGIELAANQINFAGDITGSGNKLTINTPVLKSTVANPAPGSAAITLGELEFAQDSSIQTQDPTTIAFTVPVISGSGKTITQATSGSTFTFAGDVAIDPSFVTSAGTNFTASTGQMTFKADLNLTNGTFNANSGTIVLSAANKAGAAADLSGSKEYNNLTFTGPVNILGDNKIGTLTANSLGGITLTFAAGSSQTVTNLTLTGSSTDSRLTLTSGGAWTLNCSDPDPSVSYVDVIYSTSVNEIIATGSNDSGHNTNWNFPGMAYTWKTSATDSSWTNASNWTPESVPGKGALVTIPAAAYYPVLTADLNILYNSTQGTITVNGTFDLADKSLTVAEIQNNGTLRANGVTGQSVTGTMKNGSDSTVEYYGTGNNNLFWDGNDDGKQYVNLILDQEITYNGAIAAGGDITIKKTSTLNGNVSAAGNITVNNTAASVTFGGTVTITGNTGVLTVNAPLTYNGTAITTKAAQTYNSSVTISQDASFTANNGSTILFGGTVAGSAGTEKLTLPTAAVQFNGNVSNLAELTTAAATINCTSVSTSGDQTYGGAVTIKATTTGLTSDSGDISFANTISGDAGTETLTLGAGTLSFANSVTNLANLTVNADISIGTSGIQLVASNQISFAGDISAAGKTLTINTPALNSTGASSSSITANQITLSQATTVTSSNGIILSALTVSGSVLTITNSSALTLGSGINIIPAIVNNGTITCAGAATFKGTYSGTGATLNLLAATTTFKNNLDLSGTTLNASTGTVQFNGDGTTTQTLTTKADGSTHFYKIAVATPAKVSTTSNFYVDGTTWTNSTATDGFIATTPSQITFANSSITIGGKNTFNKIVLPTASQTVNVTGSNNITDLTSSGASQNITFNSSNIFGTLQVSGAGTNLTAENDQNQFNDTITIGSASVAAGTISLKAQTTLNFAANFNCDSVTLDAAANAVTFNGNAAYNTSFVNNGTAATTFLASFTGSGNATFDSDAILQGTTGSAYNLSCPANLIKCKNFVLYSGNYTFSGNLETTGDVIILGSNYEVDDSETGIANVFAYNQTRLSDPQFSGTFPVASSLSGTITANANASIKVGKNFYANGTSLQGNSDWYIQLPKICDANKGFAEAIKTSAKNCKVSCWETPSNTATDDNANAKIAAYSCTDNSGNANWDFADFTINGAYTIRDNAICITFSDPVRNLNNEINGSGGTIQYLKYQNATGTTSSFEGFYSKPDCQNENKILGTDLPKIVYIKAPSTWNTDANGKSPGEEGSTDRNGIHKTAIPYLDIPRSLTATAAGTTDNVNYIITNKWGKRLNNYSTRTPTSSHAYGDSGDSNDVLDKTGPVLYSVRTGQELHTASTNEANVKSIDSHNFIEFRYSEPVDFDDSASPTYTALNTIPADPDDADQNIQVTDSFGALAGNITSAGPLTITGLGIIENGLIHTGSNGNTDKYVNSLYRRDAYSICLSIAGYTDGTVTDNNGYTYKKWIGYIEHAQQPTGKVTFLVDSNKKNLLVKDKNNNAQEKYDHDQSNTIPEIISEKQGLYGKWDISEPVFAIIRQNKSTAWSQAIYEVNFAEHNKWPQAEAIGNNTGVGSTLDRIEFHLFDNTPKFDGTEPEWFTEVGWCNTNSDGKKETDRYKDFSYAADIFGGSRAFDSDNPSGGIRYCSLQNSASAFKYGIGTLPESAVNISFDSSLYVYGAASSLIFTGASNPRRSAQEAEGLYFALPLADTSLDVKTSFTVHYDESRGYITDLAGNRLRSKTITTIDRTPPSIDMTICPIGSDEVEIVFVKKLCIDSRDINYIKNPVTLEKIHIDEEFEYLISQCLDIITIADDGTAHQVDASDLKFDTSKAAKVWVTTNSMGSGFTHIKLKLSRSVTLQDIQEKFIRITYIDDPKYGEYSVDLFTQHAGSRVTFIQDENGNTIQMYTAHALSDFAVGEVNPLYAYDSSMTEGDGTIISGGLWHTDTSDDVDPQSWAVHDWNRDQKNYGTLPAGHTLAIVADTISAANVNIYLANKPDARSLSTQANKDFEFETPWRIWLPDLMPGVFTPLAEKNNTSFAQKSGELLGDKANRFIFDLDSSITDLWSSGDQVSFLFGITKDDGSPVTIMHSPELDIDHDMQYLPTSTKMPLFALRQTDPEDFLSLDLWSFRLQSIAAQRGGVTVLNNVIDSTAGEKVVIRVDLPKEGNLNVLVMTLDGNIVDYLQRGNASKGEHYYSWDGSNRSGKPVARGMYFIRVMADGIDETRKVMVVKE